MNFNFKPAFIFTVFFAVIVALNAQKSFAQPLAMGISKMQLQEKYQNNKLKILIVPGHDNDTWGTEFWGIREANLNLALAQNLYNLLTKDSHFQVFITRDYNGYAPIFKNYFIKQKGSIEQFKYYTQKLFNEAFPDFENNFGVFHNEAKEDVAFKLYGINKWANDNAVDLVIHVHFNDYGGRPRNKIGKYSGFSIYVPEKQLPNSVISKELADLVFKNINMISAVSDLPKEDAGVVEDQELIAVGANASLDAASLLIEYGYIYESQFLNSVSRKNVFKELAHLTYFGLLKYFNPVAANENKYSFSFLPYKWKDNLSAGMKNKKDILALQLALVEEGVYPPRNLTLRDCPITGNFLNCTKLAVKEFQEKYDKEILMPVKLDKGNGKVGKLTIKKLNELYSK